MKYLVVLVVVVLVLWLARSARRGGGSPRRTATNKPAALEDMVSCAHCGLHLPRSDALPGRGGLYCGPAHRAEHERSMP